MIAMLALNPSRRRGRRWIENQLWGTRGEDQAHNSLRQALVEARRSLSIFSDCLGSDRRNVWLDAEHFNVVQDPARGAFLEDIAIGDDGYNSWKAAQIKPTVPAHVAVCKESPLSIQCETALEPSCASGILGEIIAQHVGNSISQVIKTTEISTDQNICQPTVKVCANVISEDGHNTAILKIIQPKSGIVLFSQMFQFLGSATRLIDSEALSKASFDAAECVAGKLPLALGTDQPALKTSALTQLALYRMFSFEDSALVEADTLLEQAYMTDENGISLAWRALLQMIRAMEQIDADQDHLQDLATELMWRAEERDDTNPMVHSLTAIIRIMLFDAYDQAQLAAQRAIDLSPNNPFALQAAALANLRNKRPQHAYQLSTRARRITMRSKFRHWWDIQHCTVCLASGRFQEAIASAESALRRAPNNRPMMRQLIGLYAKRKDFKKAQIQCDNLRALEPGFVLDRMEYDDDYPVLTLRNAGLIKDVALLRDAIL